MKKYYVLSVLIILILILINVSDALSQNLFISGNNNSSTVICADGGVLSFGKNEVGQLGAGFTSAYSATPVPLAGNIKFMQVDAGSGAQSIGLACDRTVWSWGNNNHGQLGNGGSEQYDSVPVKVLKGLTPSSSPYLESAKYVSSGNDESFAILSSGELVSWGRNDFGQLGNGTTISSPTPVYVMIDATTRLTNVIAVEGGDQNGVALLGDGTVWTWGRNEAGNLQLGRPSGAVSPYAAKVVKKDGSFLTGIIQISAGDKHGLAIDGNGNVWSWGGDWGPGQLGQTNGFDTQSYAERVAGVGGVGYLSNVVSVAAGQAHSIAVLADGRVVSWGANSFYNCGTGCSTPSGQLGLGTTANGAQGSAQEFPRYVLSGPGVQLTNIRSVSDGDAWTFAVSNDNKLYAWGFNVQGQLGMGHTNQVAYATELVMPGGCTVTEPCPKASLGADIETCYSFSKQLSAGSTGSFYHYKWYRNGTLTGPADTLPNYTATTWGTYVVVITDSRPQTLCIPCQQTSDTLIISEPATPYTRNHGTYCPENGDITFSVTGPGTYNWFTNPTGGTAIGAGGTVTVPKDSAKITSTNPNVYEIYVQDVSSSSGTVGPDPSLPLGGVGQRGVGNETNLVFDALAPFTLDSITIRPYVYGCPVTLNFNFEILDAANVSVGTSTYTVTLTGPACTVGQPTTNLTVPVNIAVPAGSGYRLRLNTGSNDIAWYQTGATYPMTNAGVLSITGVHPAMSWAPGSMPGFFNWQVHFGAVPYTCGRAPVRMNGCPPACVAPTSATITADSTNICSGNTTRLTANTNVGAGYIYTWYKDGVAIAGPTADLKTYIVAEGGVYTVKIADSALPNNAACALTSAPVTITEQKKASVGTVSATPQAICENSTVTLNVSGFSGVIEWQQSADGASGWARGASGSGVDSAKYTTPPLTVKTFYRARVTSGFCPAVVSSTAQVDVDKSSVAGTVSAANPKVCSGSTGSLTLTGNTGTIQWEQSANGTSGWTNAALGTGATTTNYTSPALTGTTFYRVKVTNGACPEAFSALDTVVVDSASNGGTVNAIADAVCDGSSTTVSVTGKVGTIQWQLSNDNSTWRDTSVVSPFNTGLLSKKVYYRIKATNGACPVAFSNTDSVLVSPQSVAGTVNASSASVCGSGTGTLNLTGHTGDIQWEESSNGTSGWSNVTSGTGSTATSYTTATISSTMFYRVKVKSGACPDAFSNMDTVVVTPATIGGTAFALQSAFCASGSTTIDIKDHTGTSLQWQVSHDNTSWRDTAATSPFSTAVLTRSMYYRAKVLGGACAPAFSAVAEVKIDKASAGGTINATPVDVCKHDTSVITLTGYTGSITWQQSTNGMLSWTAVSTTAKDTFVTPKLNNSIHYRAVVKNGVCAADTNAFIKVNVKTLPPFFAGKDSMVCEGTQYSYTAPSGFSNYRWHNGATGPTIVVASSGIYWVRAQAPDGCYVTDTIVVADCDTLVIPDIITPNDDPLNQRFIIRGNRLNSSLDIYNRWGTQVFTSSNYDNSWEGYGCSDGIYYYIYKRPMDKKALAGWIQIIGRGQ